MKKFLILALVLTGTAATADEGVTKAREYCRYMTSADGVTACLKVMKDVDHADKKAVSTCQYMPSSDQVVACFKAIRDRNYEATELSACQYMPSADKQIECLESTGRRSRSSKTILRVETEDDEVRPRLSGKSSGLRTTLKRALEAVRAGDGARAEALLEAAIDSTR